MYFVRQMTTAIPRVNFLEKFGSRERRGRLLAPSY